MSYAIRVRYAIAAMPCARYDEIFAATMRQLLLRRGAD